MANHHLTIAKATFSASLLRPDITTVSRDELPHFHSLLETATLHCSSSNIQKCTSWLATHILPSSQRTSAFARYLSAFAKHVKHTGNDKSCSVARRRLHVVYLVNDLLHHARHHARDKASNDNLLHAFQPIVLELVREASSGGKTRVCRRLEDLLSLWQKDGYFGPELISQAKAAISDPNAPATAPSKDATAITTAKELPFIMPSTHGDPSLPFYELPAGNYMPHIIPNKGIPMHADSIRPLQLAPGPVDESLANALRDFLRDVEGIDDEYDLLDDSNTVAEVDEMGQISYRDEAGGIAGDTYYGWSRAFCEKMKARGKLGSNGDGRRGRSRSSSISRSPSRSPRKRRRHSHSTSRSRSDRSYSRSRSRSRPPAFQRAASPHFHSNFPTPAPTFLPRTSQAPRFEAASPGTFQLQNQQQGSYQPPQQQQFHQNLPPPPPAVPTHSPFKPGMHPPYPPPLFAHGNTGMGSPPPRPPNWQGPWPPPPPPPPGMGGSPFSPAPPGYGRQDPGRQGPLGGPRGGGGGSRGGGYH